MLRLVIWPTLIGALKLNRDRVITLETWLKIHILLQHPPKPYKHLIFFSQFLCSENTQIHSDFRISSFQVENAWRILQFNRKTEKYFKEFLRFWGDAVTKLQTFVRIFNHVTRVITWCLFNFGAPNFVK